MLPPRTYTGKVSSGGWISRGRGIAPDELTTSMIEGGWDEEKLGVEMIEAAREHLRKLEKDRPHERKPSVRRFVGQRVNVGQQTISDFDIAAANGFLLRPVVPDFVR